MPATSPRAFRTSSSWRILASVDVEAGAHRRLEADLEAVGVLRGHELLPQNGTMPSESTKKTSATPTTRPGGAAPRGAPSVAGGQPIEQPIDLLPTQPRRSPTSRNREQRMGVSVSASAARSDATEMVTPNWKKNLPMIPS